MAVKYWIQQALHSLTPIKSLALKYIRKLHLMNLNFKNETALKFNCHMGWQWPALKDG